MKYALILLISFIAISSFAQLGLPVPAQWHFDGNRNVGTGDQEDWVFSILPTEKNEYIACGYVSVASIGFMPVIFKLDRFGQLVWSKLITTSSGNGYTSGSNRRGIFYQVIKTPNGYAAAGFKTSDNGSSDGPLRILITEFNESGTILNNSLFHVGSGTDLSRAYSIAMDPTNTNFIICGYSGISTDINSAYVATINYSGTRTVTNSYIKTGIGGGSTVLNKVIVKPTGGSGYDIIACGNMSMANDNTIVTGTNSDNVPETMLKKEKDILLISLTNGLVENYALTYDKSNLNSIIFNYGEYGPVTARNLLDPTSTGYASQILRDNFNDVVNNDERGTDLILTNDGNIAITAVVNRIALWGYGDDNGKNGFQDYWSHGNKAVNDPVRGYQYEYYADADAYIIKLDPSSGSILWNRNIGHFSSLDFFVKLIQLDCGDYIISGSCADYNKGINQYDAEILSTKDQASPTYPRDWIRYFHANEESNICNFALAKTNDGGFVIGGDNSGQNDNFSVTKFANPAIVNSIYDAGNAVGIYTAGGGSSSETWPNANVPNNAKLACKVVVPAGVTLNIKNCTVSFAPRDHVYDYFPNPLAWQYVGIFVEPGGTLIIDNSTLKGMTLCNESQRFMWDGIVVEGNPIKPQTGANQGVINIVNSTIEDARVGVSVREATRTYNHLQNNQTATQFDGVTANNWMNTYQPTNNKGGGILTMQNGIVKNCRVGINTGEYPTPGMGLSSHYPLTIESSHFITDNYMADMYFYSSSDGRRWGHHTNVIVNDLDGTIFWDNLFESDPNLFDPDLRGNGIGGWNAGMIVDRECHVFDMYWNCIVDPGIGNTFQNLNTGITASYAVNMSSLPIAVRHNHFIDCEKGVEVANSSNALTLAYNSFEMPEVANPFQISANLVGCTGYNVSYNKFDVSAASNNGYIGISIKNGHDLDNIVNLNTFRNLNFACIGLQQNGNTDQGLQFRCNDFLEATTSKYDMNSISRISSDLATATFLPGTLRENQGDCVGFGLPDYYTAPAGNRFFNTCATDNHLYADPFVTQMVYYNNNQAGTSFDPDPCINNSVYTNNSCFTGLQDNDVLIACPRDHEDRDYSLRLGELNAIRENEAAMTPEKENAIRLTEYLTVSDMARDYGIRHHYDSAAAILEQYSRYAEAIPFYLQAEQYAQARNAWMQLPAATAADQGFAWMTDKAINLLSAGNSWSSLTLPERDTLQIIADSNNYAGYMAAALLDNLGIARFSFPVPEIPANAAKKGAQNPLNESANTSLAVNHNFSLYPNPTAGSFTLSSTQSGLFIIYSLQGTEVMRRQVAKGDTKIELPETLAAGVYIGRLQNNTNNDWVRFVYQP